MSETPTQYNAKIIGGSRATSRRTRATLSRSAAQSVRWARTSPRPRTPWTQSSAQSASTLGRCADWIPTHVRITPRAAMPDRGPNRSPNQLTTQPLTGDQLVSRALSSLLKCGMLWYAKNWTAQAGVGVD